VYVFRVWPYRPKPLSSSITSAMQPPHLARALEGQGGSLDEGGRAERSAAAWRYEAAGQGLGKGLTNPSVWLCKEREIELIRNQ
jgi:hypothetical protein